MKKFIFNLILITPLFAYAFKIGDTTSADAARNFAISLSANVRINIYSTDSSSDLSARLLSEDKSIYLMSSDADMSHNRNFQIISDTDIPAGNYTLSVFNEHSEKNYTNATGTYTINIEEAHECAAFDNPDSDGDGICDMQDNAPTIRNSNQNDSDGDGIGDVYDNSKYGENPNDGPIADLDNDGMLNYLDDDDDNDGMKDAYEISIGFDPYSFNNLENDDDGDGFSTKVEIASKTNPNEITSHPAGEMIKDSLKASLAVIEDIHSGKNFSISVSYDINISSLTKPIVTFTPSQNTLKYLRYSLSSDKRTLKIVYLIEDQNKSINNIKVKITTEDFTGIAIEAEASNVFSINMDSTKSTPIVNDNKTLTPIIRYFLN